MKIGIIGLGKVGTSFAMSCALTKELTIACAVVGKSHCIAPKELERCVKTGSMLEVLEQSEVVLLTVPDAQIEVVALELAGLVRQNSLAVNTKTCLHSSGALGVEVLASLQELGIHCGSLHPLQSFAFPRDSFSGIGMAVDGDDIAKEVAIKITEALKAEVIRVPASERKLYHAAACICSNYLVTLTALAQELLSRWTKDEETALKVLLPLLDGTLANLHQTNHAGKVLTGPIARGDWETVASHVNALPPKFMEVYVALAKATVPIATEQGKLTKAAQTKLENYLKEMKE